MSRKRGLGKGLDALIPGADALTPGGGVLQIPVEAIRRNPRQPRGAIDSQDLEELTASVRQHGILQPLIVTASQEQDIYVLIAGERRLEAARAAGLKTVPALVRQVSEQARLELALIENLQRTDLNPLEAAEGYRQLAEDFSLSHEAIAQQVGKSRTAITNTLRLLKLPKAARNALAEGKISEGHARALLGLETQPGQLAALKAILERGLNVRQTEELVRRLAGERPAPKSHRSRPPEELALEEQLREALATRVTLRRGRKGGSLIIRFFSDEELNAIVDRILGNAGGR
jgi:ParB family chromosome partitioning protein